MTDEVDPAAVELLRKVGETRWQAWSKIAARPAQLPHPTATTSMYIGGRGSGKTRSGAEWVAHRMFTEVGTYGLIVPTLEHGITECLEAHLYDIIPAAFRHWRGSVNMLETINGSRLKLYHAMQPGKVRGPNLMGKWVDEPAEMRFGMDAWINGQLATRIERPNGLPPQTFVTGTPKRVPLMLKLDELAKLRNWHRTHGTMRDNIDNLSAEIIEELTAMYEGTNLGMQELDGIMVEDVEGALLNSAQIQKYRAEQPSVNATIVGMSIDPGFSSSPLADEVGVVVGHRIGSGHSAIVELIDDCSRRGTPGVWGEHVVDKCVEHGVDVLIYEGNMVGQWVRETLESAFRDRGVTMPRVESVHSRNSKWARAEPVAALAQKGRMRMVGVFARLESELTTWVPDSGMRSPNRLDAWAQLGRFFLIKSTGSGGVARKPKGRVPTVG